MGKKSNTYKNLTLITQFGINIMVPTFLCLLIGLLVARFIGLWVVIPFLFLGMGAGMRNCYIMAVKSTKEGKKEVKDEQHSENH